MSPHMLTQWFKRRRGVEGLAVYGEELRIDRPEGARTIRFLAGNGSRPCRSTAWTRAWGRNRLVGGAWDRGDHSLEEEGRIASPEGIQAALTWAHP